MLTVRVNRSAGSPRIFVGLPARHPGSLPKVISRMASPLAFESFTGRDGFLQGIHARQPASSANRTGSLGKRCTVQARREGPPRSHKRGRKILLSPGVFLRLLLINSLRLPVSPPNRPSKVVVRQRLLNASARSYHRPIYRCEAKASEARGSTGRTEFFRETPSIRRGCRRFHHHYVGKCERSRRTFGRVNYSGRAHFSIVAFGQRRGANCAQSLADFALLLAVAPGSEGRHIGLTRLRFSVSV